MSQPKPVYDAAALRGMGVSKLISELSDEFEQHKPFLYSVFDECVSHTHAVLYLLPEHDYGCTPDSIGLLEAWIRLNQLDRTHAPPMLFFSTVIRGFIYQHYGLLLDHRPMFEQGECCERWERDTTALKILYSVPQPLRVTLGLWDATVTLLRGPKHCLGTTFC